MTQTLSHDKMLYSPVFYICENAAKGSAPATENRCQAVNFKLIAAPARKIFARGSVNKKRPFVVFVFEF